MVTSQEGTARPGGASAAGMTPCCHSLVVPCHIPVSSSFPVPDMGDATQEAAGLFCLCSPKATSLVPPLLPACCGLRLGSCLCRLLGNLGSKFSVVYPTTALLA